MSYPKEKLSGILLLVAATQFVLCLDISEALYPGYSISENYISDLGVGPPAIIFNSSVFILGLLILFAVYLNRHESNFRTLNILLFLMGIGTMGVGLFTEDFTFVHGAIASFAFSFAGLSTIASAQILKKPFSILSILLGLMTLTALSLYSLGMVTSGSITSIEPINSVFYLGLGTGGMERMIIYPSLMWLAGFGGYLLKK